MRAIAAPAIQAEMDEWVALGGSNSGIIGAYDGSHPTGFHRAGFEVPVTDYSRRHDPGKPYNMAWCCAGDFSHNGNAGLRARHATLLARLMAGEPSLSMIVEFIGQPWPDRPVMYWARWNGVKTLSRYTGRGHDHWSHISWQRSRANERAFLWRPSGFLPTTSGVDMQLNDGLNIPNWDGDPRFSPSGENTTVGTALGVASQRAFQAYMQTLAITAQLKDLAAQVQQLRAAKDAAVAPSFTDDQVERLAAALAGRPDNPLSEADVPTLVRAFKQAAREGAGS